MATILVVDDDPGNLKLAVTVLEGAGYEALSATSGAEGIAAALAHAPDLVLLDIQMPDMDGIAALQRLRADTRTAQIKVVALTALAMKGDRERLLVEGFDGYLEKPIRYKAFLAAIATLLGGGAGIKGKPERIRPGSVRP
jgi:two-component system cell cycle response regulator DivK